ncbi:distal tail protein Dit [Cytobacillus sp. FJAT-53684]|uniref:Distal tail protein Dit n=1 Tax=Cytobacillus mangrovibacter TaxID=3299024 RepID=A0ABW6K3V5_9BACI
MKSLTFNGTRKPWLILLRGRKKPPFSTVRRNLLSIPGRHGAFLHTSTKEPLVINQPISFIVNDDYNALQYKDELAEWLVTDEPVPLTFDDEPGRIYYAVVQNTIDDFERIASIRQGTIQFICPDPYGYSEEIAQNISSNNNLINSGTAETYPIFDIDVLKNITRLEVINKSLSDRQGASPSIVLGVAASMEQEEFAKEELIFQDSMQSTQTWQTAVEVDAGHIAGTVGVDSKGFYPATYGNAIYPLDWQGPSLIKGIGTSLQDFKADIYIENLNVDKETGMLDVYLRDSNSNVLAKISFGDAWKGKTENFGNAQVGDYNSTLKMSATADDPKGWNNFSGIIRVIRVDNVWNFYFAQIDKSGTHNWVHSRTRITDNARRYMSPVTSIQVAFRLWAGTVRTDMHIKNIKIYKINKPTGSGASQSVPFVAQAGDRLTIDTKKSLILKNGEFANELADLSLQMFPFAKGHNMLQIIPSDAVNVTARYRRAYL